MLLAGDVGGTKTLLGLFKAIGSRPPQVAAREYSTLDFPSLAAMIEDFIKAVGSSSRIEAACFGVAGPVIGNAGRLTNVPWRVDGDEIAGTFGISHVSLLNDLDAMAHAVPVLDRERTAHPAAGRAGPRRQHRRDRGRDRSGRGAAPPRRRPLRAVARGRRPRRLRTAQRTRDRPAPRADGEVRTRVGGTCVCRGRGFRTFTE